MSILRIHAAELTPDHMRWLREMTDLSDRGHTPLSVIQDEVAGQVQFFDVQHPEGRGLIVTQVNGFPGGRELYVWGVAGENAGKVMQSVWRDLKTTAKIWNCKWLGWRASRAGMQRLYEKYLGLGAEGKFYSVEVG